MKGSFFRIIVGLIVLSSSVEGANRREGRAIGDSITKRENLKGADVVPRIGFPGITQEQFADAFVVLDECLIMNEPRFGFNYPFIAPGGHYGGCWWQLDASIAMQGAKWVNQRFVENMLRGFAAVQRSDGRIPLYGHDHVANYPIGSSLPKLFGAAYAVLRQSNDRELTRSTYDILKKYLDWWFAVRKDEKTGLITGVFEESFPPFENQEKNTAQVDLNVEVVVGCTVVAKLAAELGLSEDSRRYMKYGEDLKTSINRFLWNGRLGAYYTYNVRENKFDDKLLVSTFDPMRLQIADPARLPVMIGMLTGDNFNWAHNGLTSAAKTDPIYNETTGAYNGNPAWSGDIWTLRNDAVIDGLEAIGRYDLAACLSLKTVRLFNNNYTEFLAPSDGSGHGVKRYAWSAAQYIQTIVERIFGVEYDGFAKTITIRPNLDESLEGEKLSLQELLLPDGNRLNLIVKKQAGTTQIDYAITGGKNTMQVVIALPVAAGKSCSVVNAKGKHLKSSREKIGLVRATGGNKASGSLRFVEK
jgi:glycogen debranching enzyme